MTRLKAGRVAYGNLQRRRTLKKPYQCREPRFNPARRVALDEALVGKGAPVVLLLQPGLEGSWVVLAAVLFV